MTHSPRTLFTLLLASLLFVGCGLSIEKSKPLTFVAPLQGVWIDSADSDIELRVMVTGGNYPFNGQFSFAADIVDTDAGTTTSYVGSADGETFELRDPATGALLLSGSVTEEALTSLLLSDQRVFSKPFVPDFLSGTWQDVNFSDRRYHFDSDNGSGTATGCALIPVGVEDDIGGVTIATYTGDAIDLFRVKNSTGAVRISAPGFFVGASSIRIQRVNGFVHLQRVDQIGICPPG